MPDFAPLVYLRKADNWNCSLVADLSFFEHPILQHICNKHFIFFGKSLFGIFYELKIKTCVAAVEPVEAVEVKFTFMPVFFIMHCVDCIMKFNMTVFWNVVNIIIIAGAYQRSFFLRKVLGLIFIPARKIKVSPESVWQSLSVFFAKIVSTGLFTKLSVRADNKIWKKIFPVKIISVKFFLQKLRLHVIKNFKIAFGDFQIPANLTVNFFCLSTY